MQSYEIKQLKKKNKELEHAVTFLQKSLPVADSPPNLFTWYFGILSVLLVMLVCIILVLIRKVKKFDEKLNKWKENGIIIEDD